MNITWLGHSCFLIESAAQGHQMIPLAEGLFVSGFYIIFLHFQSF